MTELDYILDVHRREAEQCRVTYREIDPHE